MQTEAWTQSDPLLESSVDQGWGAGSLGTRPSRRQYGWDDGESIRAGSERRARGLGFFSLALGLSQLTVPGYVAKLIGLRDTPSTRAVLRAIGVRELASGVGLLSKPESSGFVWSRVAGDAIDLALLGSSLTDGAENRARVAAATAAVVGVAAVDVLSAARLSRSEAVQKWVMPIHVVRSITINRSPEVVYSFWRDLENLPRFMAHLEEVRQEEDGSSVWRAKAPAGTSIEWQAEITLDRPNEAIAWRALEGATVPNRGVVRFKPGPAGRGTELLVELKYDPPGGALGAFVAKLFGEEPGQQIASDLRRLKQVLETGSVVHSDATIHRGMHAAVPAAEHENTQIIGESEAAQ